MIFIQLLLLLACILIGCQSPKPEKKNNFRINVVSEPVTLDPGKARSLQGFIILKALFEGLTRINPQEQVELALAQDISLSEDLKTYTFFLRPSEWTDGKALTAHDFVFAWKRILLPDFTGDQAFQLYPIKNARSIKKGEMPIDALGVKALDALTLQVELESPTPYFLKLLSLPVFSPVSSLMSESSGTFITNGPFKLKKWQHNSNIILEKNPLYWDSESVNLDSIEMFMVEDQATELSMFEKKELDWAGSPISVISLDALNSPKLKGKFQRKPLNGTQFIRVNTEREPFKDSQVRRTLSQALDRKEIVESITHKTQTPAHSLIPNSKVQLVDKDNVAPAQIAFKEHFGKKEISLTYPSNIRTHLFAQAIQQQWNTVLGLTVKLEPIEAKVYYSRLAKHDYDLALGDFIADFDDPINFLEVFKYKTGNNNTQWENSNYTLMLDHLKESKDPIERDIILQKSEELLMNEMPIIPIFHYNMVYLKSDEFENVALSSLGILDFKWIKPCGE